MYVLVWYKATGSWVRRSIDYAMTGGKRSILAAIFCTIWSIIIRTNGPVLFAGAGVAGAAWFFCIIWNICPIRCYRFHYIIRTSVLSYISIVPYLYSQISIHLRQLICILISENCCASCLNLPISHYLIKIWTKYQQHGSYRANSLPTVNIDSEAF